MRILLFFLLAFPIHAIDLQSGVYSAIKSNSDSICPQKIKVEKKDGAIFLRVVYVGDCFYQGPYLYYCKNNICTDGLVDYTVADKNHFSWVNKNYDTWAEFKKDN